MAFFDDVHVRKIARALWASSPNGRAALLVGAGFSRNAMPVRSGAPIMPSWSDLYANMVEQLYPVGTDDTRRVWLLGQAGATSAFLRIAEEYRAQFGGEALDSLITSSVPDDQFAPGELHSQLLQLPWSDVLTTNWDTLLERSALTLEERVYDLVLTPEDIPVARAPRIVKLHGSLPSQRPFVFTEEDFRTYPDRFAPFINLARQSAMENTLVLMGFSGEDPNFLYWSGWVRDQLGERAPLIYLAGALDLSPSRRKMLEAQRIQPIDLAHLPEFASWPEGQRISLANQWFLETLRAAEPYRADRWPRPKARLSPPLKLITPPMESSGPSPEPSWDGRDVTQQALRELTEHWRRNRLCYPGWVVPPADTSSYLWGRLVGRLDGVITAIASLPPAERIEPLFELNWQLETALVPLALTIDDVIIETLGPMWADERSQIAPSTQVIHLALAVLRHAREVGDAELFHKIDNWVGRRLGEPSEQNERLHYERCQFLRTQGDLAELEKALETWTVSGDPFWRVRKAGLIAGLGRDEEAGRLGLEALIAVRQQAQRGRPDIGSWSRESLAMLFRWFFSHGQTGQWEEALADRERFDEREDLLSRRGSSHRADYFALRQKLDAVPPPLKELVERRRKFDVGAYNTKLNLAGEDPRVTRLAAYRAIRFQEECGLPARLSYVDVFGKALERAAVWLVDVDPHRALDALLRTLPQGGEDFDHLLSRRSVANLEVPQANELIDQLIRMFRVAFQHGRDANPVANYWVDRLKSIVELLSRIVQRVPDRAAELMDLAQEILADPQLSRRVVAGETLQTLLRRVVDLLPPAKLAHVALQILSLPIRPKAPNIAAEYVDPASFLHGKLGGLERTTDWDEPVSRALEAALERSTRKAAIERLELLWASGLLDEKECEEFGSVLWAPQFLKEGLPGTGFYLAVAYLTRPHPQYIDVQSALSTSLIADAPLDDAVIRAQSLSSVVSASKFEMMTGEVRVQILRLRNYVETHTGRPDHPFAAFERPGELVSETSTIFAGLCRRSMEDPENGRLSLELAANAKFPLRIEPALFALVAMGFPREDALQLLRETLDHDDEDAHHSREVLFSEYLKLETPDQAFEQEFWEELSRRLLARTQVLPQLLRFLAVIATDAPDRLGARFDRPLAFLIDQLLSETAMSRDDSDLRYDSFAARLWACTLARRLGCLGRLPLEIIRDWETAVNQDPLPDTKRAWRQSAETEDEN